MFMYKTITVTVIQDRWYYRVFILQPLEKFGEQGGFITLYKYV